MFLEGGALLIIVAPLLVPLVKIMNIDLIHFGLIMIVNIMIGGRGSGWPVCRGNLAFYSCTASGVDCSDIYAFCSDVSSKSFIRKVESFLAVIHWRASQIGFNQSKICVLGN